MLWLFQSCLSGYTITQVYRIITPLNVIVLRLVCKTSLRSYLYMLPVFIMEWMTNKAFTVSCSYSALIFCAECVCVCVLKVVLCSISVVVFSIMASPVWTFGISPASSLTVREVKGWNGMLLCIFSRTMKHLGLGCLGIMNEKSIWKIFYFFLFFSHSSDVLTIYRQHKCGLINILMIVWKYVIYNLIFHRYTYSRKQKFAYP